MSNVFDDQADFMTAAEQTTGQYNPDQTMLYLDLVTEEFKEVLSAVSIEGLVKELADLIVVCVGTLHSIGVEPELVWDEVHRSNMSKCTMHPDTGRPMLVKRADGKVLKPESYSPANIRPFIDEIDGLPEDEDVDVDNTAVDNALVGVM